ncbi:hypothetical protein AB4Z10_09285 [Bosea sp. RAF48]|uniref:hypothetical protein n=1 Tax=Bosea sp. RAF48 TaxID=3237480 RepID=UPI003F914040
MQPLPIIIAVHLLSSVFWAGTTFVLARAGGADAAGLAKPQMGAAFVAMGSGILLWQLAHAGGFGSMEATLAVGAATALTAFAIQAIGALWALRSGAAGPAATPGRIQRVAAALLMVTVVCMAIARYA